MRHLTFFFMAMLVLFPASGQELDRKARELNSHSKRLLGVDVTTLQWLLQVNEGQYLLKSALDQTGDLARIQELKEKDFIRFRVVRGLPNGRELETEFIQIVPTAHGGEVIRALK